MLFDAAHNEFHAVPEVCMFFTRSNYFAVCDVNDFDDFCDRHDLQRIQSRDNKTLFGFLCQSEVQPEIWANETGQVSDFLSDFISILAKGHVAVVIQVGSDKMRFLLGHTWAINSQGEVRQVDLDDIYAQAKTLSVAEVTRAEY